MVTLGSTVLVALIKPDQRRALFLLTLTFITISDRVKVHIIFFIGEEEEAEPGVEGIDGDYKEDPHYVPLFIRRAVVTQVHVDLRRKQKTLH